MYKTKDYLKVEFEIFKGLALNQIQIIGLNTYIKIEIILFLIIIKY